VGRAKLWSSVVACGVTVVTGCGGGGSSVDDLDLGTGPPAAATASTVGTVESTAASASTASGPVDTVSTSTAPPTTAAPLGEWVPVTGNLVGLPSECGNVSVVSQPLSDLLVVGIARQGLYTVAPGTTEWSPLGTGGDPLQNRLSSILADPERPETFWQIGNYGDGGVYRTDDRGTSFQLLGDITHLDYLGVDFTDPERKTLLAGTHEQSIVHRSTDGGATWSEIGGLPAGIGTTAAPWVIDANTYLIGSHNGEADGIFRSTDAGATWTRVYDGSGVVGQPVDRDGSISWLLETGGGVVTSTDRGVTWTAQPANGAISALALQLVPLPEGGMATIGNDHVVRTDDGGATWTQVGPPLPYRANNIGYSAGEETFYVTRFDCSFTDDNPVPPDGVLRLEPGS
jgi:photosystem II stability/assembly factor-like uncharacterized protein